jgi:hypothetical protein
MTTLAVTAGLLAGTVPAAALAHDDVTLAKRAPQAMLDYEGSPVVTYAWSLGREGSIEALRTSSPAR